VARPMKLEKVHLMRDRTLQPHEVKELDEFRKMGLRLIECEDDRVDTDAILEKIDDFVRGVQAKDHTAQLALAADDERLIDLAWGLGSLLGNEFVCRFGWQWCFIVDGEMEKYGVVSPDRALMLYPSFFVRDCLWDSNRDFTGHLIVNMVAADRFKDVAAKTYLNLAENVVRIVPR